MKNGNWKGVFSHDLCIFERELLKSSGQLCTVISTERSSFYKHYLCWHLNCYILRSYLSSHVILSSFPQYLTFWKSGVQTKRKKVWSVKKTRLWLFTKEIRQKGSHQCHFVPGLASGVLVGLPCILFYSVLVTTLWGRFYSPLPLYTDEEGKAQGKLTN